MLRPDRGIERVYLHRAPVDMRKQIDGLAILAKEVIGEDPMAGAMFAFHRHAAPRRANPSAHPARRRGALYALTSSYPAIPRH